MNKWNSVAWLEGNLAREVSQIDIPHNAFPFQTPDSKSYPNKHILLGAVTMDKCVCALVSLCDMRHSGTLKTKGCYHLTVQSC